MKDAARFFKVLADESRLQMLWLLLNQRELCVCDIMAVLEITQSKASRHLATLRNVGIAADRREGQWSYYSIVPVKDALARAHLELLQKTLARRPDAGPLLGKLREWLAVKKQDGFCVNDGVCGSAPAAGTLAAVLGRARRAGAGRRD